MGVSQNQGPIPLGGGFLLVSLQNHPQHMGSPTLRNTHSTHPKTSVCIMFPLSFPVSASTPSFELKKQTVQTNCRNHRTPKATPSRTPRHQLACKWRITREPNRRSHPFAVCPPGKISSGDIPNMRCSLGVSLLSQRVGGVPQSSFWTNPGSPSISNQKVMPKPASCPLSRFGAGVIFSTYVAVWKSRRVSLVNGINPM